LRLLRVAYRYFYLASYVFIVMHQLLCAVFLLAVFTFFLVVPKRRATPPPPPSSDGDDGGGEPYDPGLPDLDLPPGISRPINDWEPEYNRRRVLH